MTQPSDETNIVFGPGSPTDPAGEPGPATSGVGETLTGSLSDTAADTGRTIEAADGAAEGEPGLTAADRATVEALHVGTALLLVQHGPTAGARFLLNNDVVTVGRHPGNDIFLDDVTVSRKHAEFRRAAGGFVVRDVGSLNGTYVRRARIDGDVQLVSGDEVQVGKFRFLFQQSARGEGGAQQRSAADSEGGGGS